MIYLLDTHVFIWSTIKTNNLSKKCKELICNRNNEICVSTVSLWEISIKTSINKFIFEKININSFPQFARNMNFSIIELQEEEAISFHELPLKENHKDPFDRMLIWQAISRNIVMISKDRLFQQYKEDGLKLFW